MISLYQEGQQPCCSKMLGPPEWLCDNEELLGKASLIVNNDIGSIDALNAIHNPTNIHYMFRAVNTDSETKGKGTLKHIFIRLWCTSSSLCEDVYVLCN